MDGKHVQTVEQILTETPVRNRRIQIPICGGQHAHIDRDGSEPTDTFKCAFLEHSQECHLGFWWQLADFIQKERSTVGGFEPPDSPLNGAGERTLLMAEEFRRDERGRTRRAVDADERATGPC